VARLNDIKFAKKFAILVGVLFAGFAVFGWVAADTLGAVEVSGPAYQRIVSSKDLIADVLPPPAYIIETHLSALELVEATSQSARSSIVERLQALRRDFETRHAFWQRTLADGPTKQALVVDSARTARQYFGIVDAQLVPAVQRGDGASARRVLRDELSPLYAQHRAAIDRVVRLATAQNAAVERSAHDLVRSRTAWLLATAVLVLAGGIGAAVYLARRTTRPLVELTDVARAIAHGDLTRSVDYVGRDETGALAEAFRSIVERVGTAMPPNHSLR
jgi:methyl-accepting chemotaxis protein